MGFKERVRDDVARVFRLRPYKPGMTEADLKHFEEIHTWNGKPFLCISDGESALKRKNNNVVDLSWDNNTFETLIYAAVDGFPGRVIPNESVLFDLKQMKIMQVQQDMGVYTIMLAVPDSKAVAE